jgi:hypothetical protein
MCSSTVRLSEWIECAIGLLSKRDHGGIKHRAKTLIHRCCIQNSLKKVEDVLYHAATSHKKRTHFYPPYLRKNIPFSSTTEESIG